MADWTETYRPESLAEVRGNDTARDAFREWAETWDDHREAVVLHGSPGVGKTSAAHALAKDLGWAVVELNASDQRTADEIEWIRTIQRNVRDFLENGNIRHSVNFPETTLPRERAHRIAIPHANKPNMVAQILTAVGEQDLNIADMINNSRGDIFYTCPSYTSHAVDDLLRAFSCPSRHSNIKFIPTPPTFPVLPSPFPPSPLFLPFSSLPTRSLVL
jgi:DNA polymerase III delta prime subunit